MGRASTIRKAAREAECSEPPPDDGFVAPWNGRLPKRAVAEVSALCCETVLPVVVTAAMALALLPAPRFVAWFVLLLVPTAFGWRAGSSPGVVSALTACLAFLLVHGRPRFASTITDTVTIRAGFMLGILGAICAVAASWRAHTARPPTAVSRTGSHP